MTSKCPLCKKVEENLDHFVAPLSFDMRFMERLYLYPNCSLGLPSYCKGSSGGNWNGHFTPSTGIKKMCGWQLLSISYGKYGKKGITLSLKICFSPIVDLKFLLSTLLLLGLLF